MRNYPFHYEPQITPLIDAYHKRLSSFSPGPEGTVGEYEAKLSTLSFDELLDRLLEACPQTYDRVAFDCVPEHERMQRLLGLAEGRFRAETHWPLLGNFFDALLFRSRHDAFDFDAAGEAIITAFNQRLSDSQRERVLEHVTSTVDFNAVAQGRRRDPWFINRFTPVAEYYSPWMLHVLGSTVGKVSRLVYTRHYPEACRINHALSSQALHCVLLTLDFREDPRKYWNPTPDSVVERLGACLCTGPDSPHVVLFMRGIAGAAEGMEHPEWAHELGKLVFLHEFAHAVHLGLDDTDGLRNPAAPPPWKRTDWVELVAQMFTWNEVKRDATLADLFERLTDISPPEYQTWRSMRDCSMEDFRAYLWFLRRDGAVKNGFDFQDWFCAGYQQLPPIPRPPTKENVLSNATSGIDE